jgi:hypothetical protein
MHDNINNYSDHSHNNQSINNQPYLKTHKLLDNSGNDLTRSFSLKNAADDVINK